MTSFKRMRLIPEYMYEKLNQTSTPRTVDFGDETNTVIFDLTADISPILRDKSRPLEERIRLFYQHLVRKLSADASKKSLEEKEDDKKQTDLEKVKKLEQEASKASLAHAVKQRNDKLLPVKKPRKQKKEPDVGTLFRPPKKTKLEPTQTKQPTETESLQEPEESIFPQQIPDENKVMEEEEEDEVASEEGVDTWKEELKSDLSSGNRLGAQRRLRTLLSDYFVIDGKTGDLFFKDDHKQLRGADIHKILNYFIPMKNIHPKNKPNGTAAIVEILRARKLNDGTLFPNESVAATFSEYGMKPTAFKNKIKTLEAINSQIRSIASGLKLIGNESRNETTPSPATEVAMEDWETFS